MEDPLRIITESEGVFLRREALGCGYDDKGLARALREGSLVRVRHGAYCFRDVWDTLTSEERHLTLARAVLRTTTGPVALSHTTALLAHGISVWGADLTRVHVTRLDSGSARLERDVIHHAGLCPDEDVLPVSGLPVTAVTRAVLEAGTVLSLESALVSADSALHRGLTNPDALRSAFSSVNAWPGSRRLHVVLHHMDGRAETPGETRSRYLFWRQGLPTPELQWPVYDHTGRLVALLDFAWPDYGVFGEFDGRIKYGRLLQPGQEPGDVVFAEKRREDLVREITGWRCGRLGWVDLARPAATADRFRRLLTRAA